MTTLHRFQSLVQNWFSPAPAILALAVLATACGAHDDERPAPLAAVETEETTPDDKDDDDDDHDSKGRKCEEGDAKECRIVLPKQGSVQNCIDGVRYCEKGQWGPCETD